MRSRPIRGVDSVRAWAKVIPSLSHPSICTLHDMRSQDGVECLVTEHIDTCPGVLHRGPMPLAEARREGIEICEARHVMHRASVMPRDLEPSTGYEILARPPRP